MRANLLSPHYVEAVSRRRRIQMDLGRYAKPETAILFGLKWAAALQIDPEGRELKHVLDELQEVLTPMRV